MSWVRRHLVMIVALLVLAYLFVPIGYYREAFALFRRHLPRLTRVRHGFQTNATLIDDSWCRFFRDEGADVGVSLDGPAWLHDAHWLRKAESVVKRPMALAA